MMVSSSITRRLTLTVLLLEFVAALALVALVTNHERHVQFENMDANLSATANALLGNVQEADAQDGSVQLLLHGIQFPHHAIYRVVADKTQVLGSNGAMPDFPVVSGTVTKARIDRQPYRLYALRGERIIDPGTSRAVIHDVVVLYGLPEGHIWHEVFEATRFFAIATVILLGITAALMTWLIRRFLSPIHELALQAEKIDAEHWVFEAPMSSKQVAELSPLATAIEKTITRLHLSFEQQRRFTSDAAHELKTDLAIVKSSFQLLCLKKRTVDEYEQGLALGLTDIGRLEGTVQKMLTLARLERGTAGPDESSDIVTTLRHAIDQSAPFASIKGVQILLQAPTEAIVVLVEDEEASLLCSNILMNALQHSPQNGTVRVDVTRDAHDVTLRFRDQGQGVTDVDLPFLFDAFYRGDASRSRTSGGTGLGLSICKAICDRTGGQISIGNHEDGGAAVLVVLPLASVSRA